MKKIIITIIFISVLFSTAYADDTYTRMYQRYVAIYGSFENDSNLFLNTHNSMADSVFNVSLVRNMAYANYLMQLYGKLNKAPQGTFTNEQMDLFSETMPFLIDFWNTFYPILRNLRGAENLFKDYTDRLERGAVTLI